MKIYRKIIPKMSKDVVRSLLNNNYIEIEDGNRDDAELDIAGAIVKYLNELDELTNTARETVTRHNMEPTALTRVRQALAEKRNLPLSEGAEEHVINQIIEALYDSDSIAEIFGEDHELRKSIHLSFTKYLGVDLELDREVRSRLKNLREGTAEWEVEYDRLIGQMRSFRSA
jgi:uncharacterized protein